MTRRPVPGRRGAAFALLLCSVLLAACGGTVGDPGASAPQAPAAITIDTARGPVGLPGPATRVVSLEWVHTEELLALGVVPVGVADIRGYGEWLQAPDVAIPPGVRDVGTRNAPSLEQITALDPDLIIASEDRVGAGYEALSRIAPVLSFDYKREPQLENLEQRFRGVGTAVGRTDRAEDVLRALEARTGELRSRLAAAGREGAAYSMAQGYTSQGAPTIRLFTDRSAAAQALNAAGLRNTWTGQADAYGLTIVGVEGLTRISPQSQFLYVANPADDPFTGALAANPLYQGLPFVAENRTTGLDSGTWQFGGPSSMMFLLDQAGRAFGV
ncbi:iron-siderophore ABC transporter substrate-binding protein [Actinomycetospora sp. OC33-EN08]|uniref:Iron-siderophore ABC transporter substrate-binding protein n=1 Tax=Actinomycetospora aurantiaca TaxID=3129233 RepID=A0ABU8MQD1_9PSEU